MQTFTYEFTVAAPVVAVAAFHGSTDVLKKLSPPPMFVQIHSFGAMTDGMIADFTLWLGPIPLHWRAEHSNVTQFGFTDTQIEGPLQTWQHTHNFVPDGPDSTIVRERIVYSHPPGLKGVFTRLLFGKPGLHFLFSYRKRVTRKSVNQLLATAQ
jgi:ligand-binding SRPBCC domain-containing protein